MDEQRKRKMKIALIVTAVLFAIGLVLLFIGQIIPHVPLFIAGCVVAGVGFIPLMIITIIAHLKQD